MEKFDQHLRAQHGLVLSAESLDQFAGDGLFRRLVVVERIEQNIGVQEAAIAHRHTRSDQAPRIRSRARKSPS